MKPIPLRDVTVSTHPPAHVVAQHPAHYEAPYRRFIAASLLVGIGGGFMLSVLLPLARTLDWSWGASARWSELVQVHGQLQLIGFGGLFVMGMALRLMPRVSGRPLANQWLVPALIPLVAGYLVLRSFGQPMEDGTVRDAALISSSALLLCGSLAFVAIAWRTLLDPRSTAAATGWFFVLGAGGLVAGAAINALQTYDMVRDSLATAPAARQTSLVFTQQFGFLMMFVSGVGSRAIPTLTGRPRPEILSRIAAVCLGSGVALFAAYALIAAEQRPSVAIVRMGLAGLLLTGVAFAMMAWISGALLPGSRVAAASRTQFWFVRSAFGWMAVAAVLVFWYAGRAIVDGEPLDQFQLDAVRHVLTVGVLTSIVVGMAMLIVPEFAGRRLQHPMERGLHISMILALNAASSLRLWPALEGVDWLEDTRYWPIAASGVLAGGVVLVFAFMFFQSWLEQRDPSWSARATGVGRPASS
jgi:hypothetical protein